MVKKLQIGKPLPTKLSDLNDDMDSISILIDSDMLPAVHDSDDKILTDEDGKIILRY